MVSRLGLPLYKQFYSHFGTYSIFGCPLLLPCHHRHAADSPHVSDGINSFWPQSPHCAHARPSEREREIGYALSWARCGGGGLDLGIWDWILRRGIRGSDVKQVGPMREDRCGPNLTVTIALVLLSPTINSFGGATRSRGENRLDSDE